MIMLNYFFKYLKQLTNYIIYQIIAFFFYEFQSTEQIVIIGHKESPESVLVSPFQESVLVK